MTRKLEELFDLPPAVEDAPPPPSTETMANIDTALAEVDKIEAALPQVKGLEASDGEMEELAEQAMSSYKDRMDLGMQVDARYASEILGVASNMLGHAITAKQAKLNKKLKMVDLQLKKLALDNRTASSVPAIPTGTGQVIDRNELLQKLLGAKDKSAEKE